MKKIICTCFLAVLWVAGCSGSRDYRIAISVNSNGFEREDKPVEVALNLAEIESVDKYSICVMEIDKEGNVIDDSVPFQFDKGSEFNLTFILKGKTAADETRNYEVRIGKKSCRNRRDVLPLVSVTDVNEHEGQESYKIETQNATYYYHKLGAGFASMEDKDGADWIGFHPTGGTGGHYRGIPNTGYPDDYCHPGKTVSVSKLLAAGPVKISIYSESDDKKWICVWDIFPNYARLTILEAITPYWFLYEGTPGGEINEDTDFCVRQNGIRISLRESWVDDIDANGQRGEWVYFGDGDRVLYLVNHEDDDAVDSYRTMHHKMTVFGFGRKRINKFMNKVPAQFTIGLYDSGDFDIISSAINSAYQPLTVDIGDIKTK